jgi:hypothetical protein
MFFSHISLFRRQVSFLLSEYFGSDSKSSTMVEEWFFFAPAIGAASLGGAEGTQ